MSVINKGTGKTPSEEYLAKLGDHSFLNLWSYPNVFNDKRPAPTAQGQEFCDLLVVCDPYVLIFSDKHIQWPGDEDLPLSWKRWYKRAIEHSIRQVRGAQRWIDKHPDRIFIDPNCTQKMPVALPPPERRIVHGIVVAGGVREACIRFFKGGIGSLAYDATLKGSADILSGTTPPFVIGDVDPEGPFVHVFDEVSLDVVLSEQDTVTDFAHYLDKKAALFRSGQFMHADGEDDILAYYMTHMTTDGEHGFPRPDGTKWEAEDRFFITPNTYGDMRRNAQYIAKKKADVPSYAWDRLIEVFTNGMLDGTSITPDGGQVEIRTHEIAVRKMALVSRYTRRHLGEQVIDVLQVGTKHDRFCRGMMPVNNSGENLTGFFYVTLAAPNPLPPGGYDQYRFVRRTMMQIYAMDFLQKDRRLDCVVGIASEPASLPAGVTGRSEDLIYVGQQEWTDEMLKTLALDKERFGIAQPGGVRERAVQGDEFPDVHIRRARPRYQPTMNRAARRKAAAKARKK